LLPGSGKKGKRLFNILHLSDFHLRKTFKGRKLFEFIQTLKDDEYDFIFITGDMVDRMSNAGYLVDMLKSLKARRGKYAVLGVHDHYNKAFYEFVRNMFKRKRIYKEVNDTKKLAKILWDSGIKVLDNETKFITLPVKGMGKMELIGLDDPIIKKLDISEAFSLLDPIEKHQIVDDSNFKKIEKEVFGINPDCKHKLNQKGVLRLVLLHTPDAHTISTLYNKKTDIILSGHTHGGQVRLPLIGAIISGCRLKTKYAAGLFYFKKLILFVSRGLGEGKYSQFRCHCPPEAVRITIYGVEK
jgi:predicted MPP superfamily phosphohydrolase